MVGSLCHLLCYGLGWLAILGRHMELELEPQSGWPYVHVTLVMGLPFVVVADAMRHDALSQANACTSCIAQVGARPAGPPDLGRRRFV